MSTVGSMDPWAATFPDGLVPAIVTLVLDAWRGMPKPARSDRETVIARSLRNALRHARNLTRTLPCAIDREVVEDDPHTAEERGRIDIRFIHGYDESVYFAFECKRLNVTGQSGRASLAREYVVEGMLRFVTGRYAAGLTQGGMIGFVMDGNVKDALAKVDAAVSSRLGLLLMASGTGFANSSLFPTAPTVRETKHPHRSPALILHHLFLEV